MLNVGGGPPRQVPLVRGLTIVFEMSGQQTTFVSCFVLLIWRCRGGLEGGGGGWCQASQVSVPHGWGAINAETEWMWCECAKR